MVSFFVSVMYTFRYKYSLTIRYFLRPKILWYLQDTHWVQNSILANYFTQFIFIDKYLKFKVTDCVIHYVKIEMWKVLFYVNSLYFQV